MDGVELRRFELKSTLIREQERKETLKVKHFNQLISASEIEVKKKEDKIIGLRESISKCGVNSEPLDKLKTVKYLLNEIRSVSLEKRGVEKTINSLSVERTGIIENILNLKNKITKIDGFVADKKTAMKLESESVNLQEIVETKVGALRSESARQVKTIEEDSNVSTNNLQELLDSQALNPSREVQKDSSFTGAMGQDTTYSNTKHESAAQQNTGKGSLEKAWQDVRAEVRGIESKTTDAGSEVSLTLNGDLGNDLKVNIEKRGDKVVRVKIETTNSIDQRKLWAKKSEIITALDKAGYTVESVNVGSVQI